jgi:hypothetical protein
MKPLFGKIKTPAMELRLTDRVAFRMIVFELFVNGVKQIDEFLRHAEYFGSEDFNLDFSDFSAMKAEDYIEPLHIYFDLARKGQSVYLDGAIDCVSVERIGNQMNINLGFSPYKSVYGQWKTAYFLAEMKKRSKNYRLKIHSDYDHYDEECPTVFFGYDTEIRDTIGILVQEGVREVEKLANEVHEFFLLIN